MSKTAFNRVEQLFNSLLAKFPANTRFFLPERIFGGKFRGYWITWILLTILFFTPFVIANITIGYPLTLEDNSIYAWILVITFFWLGILGIPLLRWWYKRKFYELAGNGVIKAGKIEDLLTRTLSTRVQNLVFIVFILYLFIHFLTAFPAEVAMYAGQINLSSHGRFGLVGGIISSALSSISAGMIAADAASMGLAMAMLPFDIEQYLEINLLHPDKSGGLGPLISIYSAIAYAGFIALGFFTLVIFGFITFVPGYSFPIIDFIIIITILWLILAGVYLFPRIKVWLLFIQPKRMEETRISKNLSKKIFSGDFVDKQDAVVALLDLYVLNELSTVAEGPFTIKSISRIILGIVPIILGVLIPRAIDILLGGS